MLRKKDAKLFLDCFDCGGSSAGLATVDGLYKPPAVLGGLARSEILLEAAPVLKPLALVLPLATPSLPLPRPGLLEEPGMPRRTNFFSEVMEAELRMTFRSSGFLGTPAA